MLLIATARTLTKITRNCIRGALFLAFEVVGEEKQAASTTSTAVGDYDVREELVAVTQNVGITSLKSSGG